MGIMTWKEMEFLSKVIKFVPWENDYNPYSGDI